MPRNNRTSCQLCSQSVTLDKQGRYEAHRKLIKGKLEPCAASGGKPYVEQSTEGVFERIKRENE